MLDAYENSGGALTNFHFRDRQGTEWMVLAGLPANYPNSGEGAGLFAGLTFRASTGQLRVLPRSSIPRRVNLDITVPALGARSRVRKLEPLDWEELLQHALPWPLA